jgi:sigma-B regulation protein RsbU (phosphoserine phosphatase)
MRNVLNKLMPFGLKPRLLALLALLTIASLFAFATVTLSLFSSDRLSYVFENQARIAENVAAQVDARLQVLATRTAPTKRKLEDAKLKGEKGVRFDDTAAGQVFWLYTVKSDAKSTDVRDGVFAFSDILPDKITKGGAEVYLIDESGRSFRASSGEVAAATDVTSKFVESPVLTGASDDGEVLRSFHKVPEWGLVVMMESRKSEALAALRSVVTKGLFVASLVLGISLILSIVFAKSLVRPLGLLKDVSEEVSSGNLDVSADEHDHDEIGVLGHSFNAMTRDIKRLLEETKEKARMQNELETASLVQATLFPKNEIRLASFQIDAHHEAATECGGDCWFQFFHGGNMYLVLGDATGHGAPAALVTSAVQSALHVISESIITRSEQPLSTAEITRLLSGTVRNCSKGEIKMTAVVARVEESSGKIFYTNASHEMPVLLSLAQDADKRIRILDAEPGLPLGAPGEPSWKEHESRMSRGEVLLAYTDGLTELPNPSGDPFGEGRLVRWIKKTDSKNSQKLKAELLELIAKHKQGLGANPDDLTFIFMGLGTKEGRA